MRSRTCYALKGKEGEKMRVKKSNMNTLIMRVYHKKVKNLDTMNILVTNVKDVLPLHRI